MERSEVEAAPVVIEADSVVKKFGGVTAVNDVSVSVREGEIYGLIGENGAGKSTLMRMLAGLYTPDSGEVRVLGKTLDGAKSALEAGIAIVHQELNLIPEMTVAENIMLGSFPTSGGFTETKKLKAVAKETLEEIGVPIDLNEPVSRLSVALRQFVEIARAIARKPRVLIMDEPTASLTPAETDYLLEMLQRLAGRGMSVVYISHRLPEIFRICNRVSVLRDGALVDTMPIEDTNPEDLVTKMVGRELKLDLEVRRESTPGDVVLSARGITAPQVRNVDLQVRAGEIVGLGGLVGAGRTELVRAVLGVDPKSAGEVTVTVDGKKKRITNYGDAVAHGVAYVPEERRTDGLALTMTVSDNIALPNRRRLSSSGVLKVGSFARLRQRARRQSGTTAAGCHPSSRRLQRRQSAEGRHRQVARPRTAAHRPRRAHPRCRRGGKGRDPPVGSRTGRRRCRRARRELGSARASRPLRRHPRHPRRPGRRHPDRRASR